MICPQGMVKKAIEAGVHITACKACAEKLAVAATLEKLRVEVKYWRIPLTEVLKSRENPLTI